MSEASNKKDQQLHLGQNSEQINQKSTALQSQAQTQFDALLTQFDKHKLDKDILIQHRADIKSAFFYSDFIQKIALQYPELFQQSLTRMYAFLSSKQTISSEYYSFYAQELAKNIAPAIQNANTIVSLEANLTPVVRQFRHICMLEIAWFDFLQKQSIHTSLFAISTLADTIITATYDCLHNAFCKRYGAPEDEQRLLILGMGKLGGGELNFSSDIDLIFTYPNQGETQHETKPLDHQTFFTRLAQKFIKLLDNITQDGRAYIVDMRLRPLGESGPLVMPFTAFENYYVEQGRQWERFAMQKMRIINQTAHNEQLHTIIQPFVYRKYIDYTTIESIREMKGMIEKEVRRRQISNDIKLGKGGIREVEFFVQSLQLIHAGRFTQCQHTSILKAMDAIEAQQLQGDIDIQSLKNDYLFLRKVEHYLQAFNDEQTQTLPVQNDHHLINNQTRLVHLLNGENFHHCQQLVDKHMQNIHKVFSNFFDDANSASNSPQAQHSATLNDNAMSEMALPNSALLDQHTDNLQSALEDIWSLDLSEAEALNALSVFIKEHNAQCLIEHINKFKKKVTRSGASQRATQSIDRLMPLLLSELIEDLLRLTPAVDTLVDITNTNKGKPKANSPVDDVFLNQCEGIFNILQTISGRVTYFDLLLEHPQVRQQLYLLCKKSVWVAQQIAQYPVLLDELLHPIYLDKNETSLKQWREQINDQLRQTMLRVDPLDEELIMDRLREFKHINQLRIAASDISGTLAINQVSDKLTLLAEVIMQQVIEYAWQQMQRLYGSPRYKQDDPNELVIISPHKHFCLIAYGKFGGIELSYGSDLDLVFLHNADLTLSTDGSGSRKTLSNQEFFIKLVQRICHICGTKTYNGILYDIDLRLRPSGNSGLLVSHIDSFYDYQMRHAWTWEHQAIVRARCISLSSKLTEQFTQCRQNILAIQRDPNKLRTEVFDMREKMRAHLDRSSYTHLDIKQSRGGIVDVEFMVQFWVLSQSHYKVDICHWSDNLRILEDLATHKVIEPRTQEALSHAYLRLRHASHRIQLANQSLARAGVNQSTKLRKAIQQVKGIFEQVFGDLV